MENEALPKVLRWEMDDKYDILEAEHYGYTKLPNPIIHRRKFLFDKKINVLKIYDFFEGKGMHVYEIHFHFPAMPLALKNGVLKTNVSEGQNISISPGLKEVKAELKEGWISPSYGIKSKAPYLYYSITARAPASFCFVFSIN